MTVSRPLLNYYGGKWNLAPWIISHMPPHEVYVEAFGGALSVFMQKDPARLEVVNDKSEELANLYRHVRSAADHLAVLLDFTPYFRAEYYAAKKERNLDLEGARKTVIASYMGVGNSLADSSNGFRNSKSSNATPSTSWRNYIREFENLHERIGSAIIECLDYQDLFEKYDDAKTLWYLDPPYVWETRSDQHANRAYKEELSDNDHRALIDRIQSLKGMVLLSGYESSIYSTLPWHKVTTIGRTQGNSKRTEVLWMNPACVEAQSQMRLFV